MKTLKNPYLQVEVKGGKSFGGNQGWMPYEFLKKSACGVIGAADVLLYLKGKYQMSESEYINFAKRLWKWYLPVIPRFGMNSLMLTFGMNRYFRKEQMPYRAIWNIGGRKILSLIDRMLTDDIPVIFSVGPNFPKFWGKQMVRLYIKNAQGNYLPVSKVKAHFMIITGRDGMWFQISSWGKEYYINFVEYQEYVRQHSNFVLSNIICIKTIKKLK